MSGRSSVPAAPRATRPIVSNDGAAYQDPSAPQPRVTLYPSAGADATHSRPSTVRSSATPSLSNRSPTRRTRDDGPTNAGSDHQAIPDDRLLREIVYVMLGSEDGQYARWSPEGCYVLRAGSLRQRNVFHRLQQCGVLRRSISRLLSGESPSFLQQSLKKAVERQLEQHDLFVASLRDQSGIQLGDLEIAHAKSEPKLHALYVILKESEAAKGGELVTRLQSLHHHGGRCMSLFLGDVYREAVRPLLHMTMHWITKGEITDPYREFFIFENDRVKETDSAYWQNRFGFRAEMLPATLSHSQARDILLIGKNIDFIRRSIRAKDWKMAPNIVALARSATFDDPKSVDLVIAEALAHTNDAVRHLLFEKNSFGQVLFAARSLFLVSTGDLFDSIVNGLEDVLAAPTLQISTSTVKEQLQAAARDIAPFLSAAENDALDYVNVVFDDAGDRLATGHDSFTISLPFIRPHNAILHDASVLEYRRLFKFLFRVKRAEVALKRAWQQSILMARSPHVRRQSSLIRQARQASVTLYKHVNGFVVNIQMYLMTEAIQGSWATLQTALTESKSLDDIIDAHERYLGSLLKYTLLDDQYSRARGEVMELLRLTFKYCELQRQLGQAVATARDAGVPQLLEAYRELFDDLHAAMSRLLTLLDEDAMHFDFLQALGARLNFNNFYHVDSDSATVDF